MVEHPVRRTWCSRNDGISAMSGATSSAGANRREVVPFAQGRLSVSTTLRLPLDPRTDQRRAQHVPRQPTEPSAVARGDDHASVKGEGLGLALVRQIAQTQGGTAGAEARAEVGARVWIELPAGWPLLPVNDRLAISALRQLLVNTGASMFGALKGLFSGKSKQSDNTVAPPDVLSSRELSDPLSNAQQDPLTNPIAPAPKTGKGKQAKPWVNKVNSGLGDNVDKMVGQSPKLSRNVKRLQKKGWTINSGDGGGCYANRSNKTIYIDNSQGVEDQVQSLAHEVGHARYKPKTKKGMDKFTAKDDYVKQNVGVDMDDEGAATIMNLKVRDEILKKNPNSDIGVAGANADKYKNLWQDHKKKGIFGSEDKLRGKIANEFGQGEITSTTNEKYDDYYGNFYKQQWDSAHTP